MEPGNSKFAEQSIKKGSKSFALASMFFDHQTRQDVWLLYSWCRFVDDIADDGQFTIEQKKRDLLAIKQNLFALVDSNLALPNLIRDQTEQMAQIAANESANPIVEHPAQKAMVHLIKKYQMNVTYALDLIRGMEWDLDFRPIRDQHDLEDYCYCVAGTVGLMMCSVMGVTDQNAFPFAKAMGNAMQLTNICRDILEDQKRQRCYLPLDLIRTKMPQQLVDRANDDQAFHYALTAMTNEQFFDLVKIQLKRADQLYQEGHRGIVYLPLRPAWAVLSARYIYQEIGVKITQRGVAAISERVYTTQFEKIILIFKALTVLVFQIPQRLMRYMKK